MSAGTLGRAYVESAVAAVVTGAALGLLAALPLVAVAGPLGAVVGLVVGVFCGPAVALLPHLLAQVLCLRVGAEAVRASVAGLLVAAAVGVLLGATGWVPWPSAGGAVGAAACCGVLGQVAAHLAVPRDDFHRGGRPG